MRNGEIVEPEAVRAIKSLKDGEYIYLIVPLVPKTINEYQRLFFYKLRSVARITGDTATDLYKFFKEDNDIPTTSKLNEEEWRTIHIILQSWIYNNLDIII